MKVGPLEKVHRGANDSFGADDGFLRRLGARVRSRRAELGISQEGLADIARLSARHLHAVEKGGQNVCILILRRIALALETPLEQLTVDSQVDETMAQSSELSYF